MQRGISDHPGDCAQLLVAQARLREDGGVGRKGQAESCQRLMQVCKFPDAHGRSKARLRAPGTQVRISSHCVCGFLPPRN